MSREEILKKVNDILKDVLDKSDLEISDATTANDVEDWDSLNHINIISSIEDEFGISFDMSEVVNFKNVGDMEDKIIEKQKI